MTRRLGLLVVIVGTALPTAGQQSATAFDTASVKASASGAVGASWAGRGPQLIIQNYPLRDIILGAYGVRPYQLAGGPDWIDTARFDTSAERRTVCLATTRCCARC